MPYGFGHLVGAWIFGKLCSRISKKKFSRELWAALLFGSILPDVDFFADWTLDGVHIHRTMTHSIVGAIIFGLLCYLFLTILNHCRKTKIERPALLAYFLFIGVMTHLVLDLVVNSSGLQIFWPFSHDWITLNFPLHHVASPPTYEELRGWLNLATFDVGLGVAWLAYFFWKKKISFN